MNKQWRYYDTYEHTDFNRIESTVLAAYNQFKNAMSLHIPPTCITDRTIQSIFVVEDINRIEKNLKYVDFSGTFKRRFWEEGGEFTFEDANRWERMYDLLIKAMAGVQTIRCGTHRCGTWPLYSVIGLVVKKTIMAGLNIQNGAYMGELCGTKPEYSVIGLITSKNGIVEAGGAVAAFEVDLCGTKPDAAEIGKAVQEIILTDGQAAGSKYAVGLCGMKYCGEEA